MHQRHKAVFRQFRFAAIADGDFGRTLHVHAAVVAREGVARQVLNRPARLHAANCGTPAILFKGAVDVGGHRIRRIAPGVVAVIGTVGLLFEIKAVDRVGTNAIWQTRKETRHHQAQIACIFRLTQAAPGGIFGVLEDFGQIARVRQLLPGFHLHHFRRGAGDKRTVCRRTDARHLTQQLNILRAVVEVVVAHQAAKRLAAELTILLLIDLLEQRTLIPASTFIALKRTTQLLLGDAHKTDFQHLVRFSVVHQIAQAAPGALQRLKLRMVNNLVHLL